MTSVRREVGDKNGRTAQALAGEIMENEMAEVVNKMLAAWGSLGIYDDFRDQTVNRLPAPLSTPRQDELVQ